MKSNEQSSPVVLSILFEPVKLYSVQDFTMNVRIYFIELYLDFWVYDEWNTAKVVAELITFY